MSDKPLTICPAELCGMKKWGKGRVKKLISAGGGPIFKGSGFYITDYRSDKYKEAAKKEAGANATAASGDSKGGDGKSTASPKSESKKTEVKPAKPSS